MADPFEGEDVVTWLVNVGDDYDSAYTFIGEAGTTLPVLLDTDQAVYSSYERDPEEAYAPFPVQVVIDRDGVITYLAFQYDAEAVRAAIEAAL